MAATYLQPVSRRRRAIALGLTLAVHALLLLLFITLGPRIERFSTDDALQTFDVAAAPAAAPRAQPQSQRRRAERTPPKEQRRPRPDVPKPPPIPFKEPSNVIWMTKEEFAATDITNLGPKNDRDGKAGEGQALAGDSKPIVGPGEGPGGAQLYNAEWQREPTQAELNPYLPPMPAGSWGIIACRTIAGFRVENCQTMGENPLGSGIATGMRRAAWQFRVIPPRLGGKPQLGTWVRIRIDFTRSGAAVR